MSRATFAFCLAFSVFTVSCLASPVQTRRASATEAGPDLKELSNNSVRLASVVTSFDLGAVSIKASRETFVKNLAKIAYHKYGAKYNVMVFNLEVDHDEKFKGIKSYSVATRKGIVYGIWVFESGSFTNKGDGGYINWAFIGKFDRYGGLVKFH